MTATRPSDSDMDRLLDGIWDASPETLADLLSDSPGPDRLWNAPDYPAVWRHQLRSPVFPETSTPGQLTFAALFTTSTPCLNTLRRVKDFAKLQCGAPENALPHEIASGLYYCTIAAAYVRLGTLISEQTEAELLQGWEWTARQSWIDPDSAALCGTAVTALGKTLKTR
jgi:hypothetical protein